jgi:hypothetical protein
MTAHTTLIRDLRFAFLSLSVLFLGGIIIARGQDVAALAEQSFISAFGYLFVTNEPPVLLVSVIFLAGVFLWLRLRPVENGNGAAILRGNEQVPRILALLVLVITVAGTIVVYHDYPLSMDEYMVKWQARIFQAHRVSAVLSEEDRPYVAALKPIFVFYDDSTGTWFARYLPIYAFMHAVFAAVSAGALLNPLMSALSVMLVAAVARKLWPQFAAAPWLAALLLASSSQFLITGMSYYTMPAHLCLTLLWLWLYLHGTSIAVLLLPWVGVLAMGLHQVFIHALFVLPFLIRILRNWSWRAIVYVGGVYFVGCVAWFGWHIIFRPIGVESQRSFATMEKVFSWPSMWQCVTQFLGLIELFSWQNLAIGLFAVVTIRRLGGSSAVLRDLAWGLLLPFVFYLFLQFDQGHGWGYRYCHAALGNLVLLAVAGAQRVEELLGGRCLQRLVLATAVLALIFLAVRGWQAETFLRPFARAMAHIEKMHTDIVLIDPKSAWYAQDLVRNDPFLTNRPRVMFTDGLTEPQLTELNRRFKLHRMSSAELASFGLIAHRAPDKENGERELDQ